MAVIDGTWESADTWGGMDTGMVKMALMTNMSPELAEEGLTIARKIHDGELDYFDGKFTVGELLGMQDYLEGIDATKLK